MFSSLKEGSLIYILDKTTNIKLKVGEVISISAPKIDYSSRPVMEMSYSSTIDITVNVDNNKYTFNNVPSSSIIINYDSGNLVLSETKEALIPTVESIIHNNEHILSNIDYYKQSLDDCNNILKELNPSFAKESERDERINKLETQMTDVSSNLKEILTLLKK